MNLKEINKQNSLKNLKFSDSSLIKDDRFEGVDFNEIIMELYVGAETGSWEGDIDGHSISIFFDRGDIDGNFIYITADGKGTASRDVPQIDSDFDLTGLLKGAINEAINEVTGTR